MNKRIKALFLLISVVIASVSFPFLLSFNSSASETTLGFVAECRIVGDKIFVSGSIKHSVLVSNRESTIGVYKLLPWENIDSVIASTSPIKQTSMSISFDFELPCLTISDKTSLYAVAIIDRAGNATRIASPRYPDAFTDDTSEIGFKGISTYNTAAALASHAGNAMVDVYLDRLDNGNKSGHIFNADGDIFYFDRDYIKQLDKQILSYTAAGCEVLLRFLISPGITNLPFCLDSRIWSTNKCIVVSNNEALNAIYGYTYFLVSRYDGDEYGKINGIILGRGADIPILYNYASLVSEDYEEAYARSLALIGLAAIDASDDYSLSLIVPVGDSLNEKGEAYASGFLSAVADYITLHSKLTFTVMCESTHNPYHIYDSMFSVDIPSDDTGEDGEEILYPETELSPPETVELSLDAETTEETGSDEFDKVSYSDYFDETIGIVPETTDLQTSEEITTIFDETSALEKPKPQINTREDGYFCTDSIDLFTDTFAKLKKKYSSLNEGFAWCWYPDENTIESALGICYSYNYMLLAAQEADFFTVAFEGEAYDRFSSMVHLFKYIDTARNIKETEYARDVFGVKEWSDLIDGHDSSTGVYNVFEESELQPNIASFVGSLEYMDFFDANSIIGWYEGIHCNSVSHQTEDGAGFLMADMSLGEAGLNQAEFGYIFKKPEPLLLGDALTFDVQCGDSDGSLYELTVYINCGNKTIVSKVVIAGGVRCLLSVDAKDVSNASAVRSMRISLTRITGSGDCKLKLFKISLNSETLRDHELGKDFDSIRDYLRSDKLEENSDKGRKAIVIVVLLSSVALVSVLFAFANDRRLSKSINQDMSNIKNKKGNMR